MNDLTNLFRRAHLPPNKLQNSSYPLNRSPFSANSTNSVPYSSGMRSTSWNLSDIQNQVRSSVKKQVGAQTVREELVIFERQLKENLSKKVLLVATMTLLLTLLLSLEGNTLFSLGMLVIVTLIPNQALSFSSEPIISKSLVWITPLLYSSVIYCLLKWSLDPSDHTVNWAFTYLSIIAAISNSVLRFYRPLFQLAATDSIVEAVGQVSLVRKLTHFPKFIVQKILFIKRLLKYVIGVVLLLGGILAGLLTRMEWFNWQIIRPTNLLKTLLFAVALQVYLQTVQFINQTTVCSLKIIRDKTPIFLHLLKLSNNAVHQQIHRQCIRSLYVQVNDNPSYLSTETCKSIAYNTYMDLFNQYAEIQLERSHNQINNALFTMRNHSRTIASSKTVIQDLFIYVRKGWACLCVEIQGISIFTRLAHNIFLFNIVAKVEREAAEGRDSTRVSEKVVDLIKVTSEKLMESAKLSAGSSVVGSQMLVNGLRIQSQIFWLKLDRK